ncbi:tetrathionate reductase family octaheme c-type cytochrome [Parasulfuritortus cantonensis]|uniref:Tetrathionate reductase family octaheme c-type cytochrome n=1 Tax=Parasulfuritortus cantonensis TaxID=2528202 RepID=A0A4R1BPG9_9PROT|nr:tetrathionate reductase family octaheme c-type cytochrome [Parasulfuritortus cantonensis]TCJ19510.1 tetrathionate reductase family octaheme c-type cytochrome [Parasulfuritortus cantonensis]
MNIRFPRWILGLIAIGLLILVPYAYQHPMMKPSQDAAANIPIKSAHVDHRDIVKGDFKTGQDVTRACLVCHKDAAAELMKTSHWTWHSKAFEVPWRKGPVTIGKINQLNNFCIGSQGNENKCNSCHIGYGWEAGKAAQQVNPENVDCLVCHADPASYGKGLFGNPSPKVNLLAAAKSVRATTRDNCGKCHFDGGGGNGVKHGDLDESLYFPARALDVHMGGKQHMKCSDCHVTRKHQILGRMLADNYTIDPAEQVSCEQCHKGTIHKDERISTHVKTVACQTCHIPAVAREEPTKVYWDWSTAGQNGRKEDHYTYLKIKGDFSYDSNITPTYLWFNGNNEYRYLLGDQINREGPTYINRPAGSIKDPKARIFPFKVHIAKQPYDKVNGYLLQPVTSGKDGFWTNFDWNQAFELAVPITGLAYSGQYGFTETYMYFPSTHMVQSPDAALQCDDCHSSTGKPGRLDWTALGYPGDPVKWGGRKLP